VSNGCFGNFGRLKCGGGSLYDSSRLLSVYVSRKNVSAVPLLKLGFMVDFGLNSFSAVGSSGNAALL
jgi:hypothetical protein